MPPSEIKDETFRKKVEAAAKKAKVPLKDAASVNTIRWKIDETLKGIGIPIIYGTGGKTKYNRTVSGLPKTHYFDAACVADNVEQPKDLSILCIKAKSYGQRDLFSFSAGENKNKTRLVGKKKAKKKKHGFNYGNRKRSGGDGFRKFDHVAMVKKNGSLYVGTINCFDYTAKKGTPRKVRVDFPRPESKDPRVSGNTKELKRLQRRDGYYYTHKSIV